MRVLFYYSAHEWSGSARAFAVAAAGLAARGYQVTYVCREESPVEHRLSYGGYEVIALPMGGTWIADALRLRGLLTENFVEVAFVHTEREQLVVSLATRLAERGDQCLTLGVHEHHLDEPFLHDSTQPPSRGKDAAPEVDRHDVDSKR